jgi:hypothetical protein
MFDPVLVQSLGNQLPVEFGPAVILAIVRAVDWTFSARVNP